MEYNLVLDGFIIQTATFMTEELPSSSNGIWLERVVEGDSSHDPIFQKTNVIHTVTETQSIETTEVVYLSIEEIKRNLQSLVDINTESAIITLAGSANTQRNKTAKSVQLLLRLQLGTITVDEQAMLDALNAEFIKTGIAPQERLIRLNTIAIEQIRLLLGYHETLPGHKND